MSVSQVTLFLDFDGVTHPEHCHERLHFSRLAGIEGVLRGCPSAEVVLSTTWRYQYSLEDLRRRFSADIQPRVIDVTPRASSLPDGPPRLDSYPRHRECWHWMLRNRGASDCWLAIDDRPYLFRPFFDAVIESDSKTGADERVLALLKMRLMQKAWGA